MGWLDMSERYERPEPVELCGLSLMRVGLPPDCSVRQLDRGLKALVRRGIRRVLLPAGVSVPEALARRRISAVDPLPLCRSLALPLALTLLAPLPPRQRTVALWGGPGTAGLLCTLAEALCPQVGCLLLEEGQGELGEHLRRRFGAVVLTPARGPVPDLTVELGPGAGAAGKRLKLWGRPELGGLVLQPGDMASPPSVDSLLLTALLWETGRLEIGQIQVVEGGVPLDITGKKSYNS